MRTRNLKSRDGEDTRLTDEDLQHLESRLRGRLIAPDRAEYEEARQVYNAMHDRHPGFIVRAKNVADVIATVNFARERDLLLALRGGGHSVPGFGTCDGGVVLDLGGMTGIRVDPERRRARAEGGCTWGDFNHATHAFGMATTGGIVSTTGIAGLTLGGGIGHLSRRCGLSCDSLVSADVVTADGRLVTCDAKHEPDLFWALRGGGGNFGAVTSFEYALHPVAEIYGGPTFYEIDPGTLRNYTDLIRGAPHELGAIFAIAQAPPLPFVPEAWHGKPVMAVIACWSGDPQKDDAIAADLSGLGRVVGQALWRMPYPDINTLFDELLPKGLYHYWKANFAQRVDEGAIAAHVEHGPKVSSLESGTFLMPIDAACQHMSGDEAAFARRDCAWAVVIAGSWRERADAERGRTWVRGYYDALQPFSEEAGYVNFMSEDDGDRVASNYGPNFARLREIKAKYDPGNLFRLNQNVPPA
jgi:FAD/FMN-containing dehydrogenase